jgi:predicted nucleic acid-binding protein
MPEREEVVISDTSPLLYLHQIDQLDLLPKLYGRVVVPPAVRKELRTGAERGFSTPDVDQIDWLEVRMLTDMTLLPMAIDLGPGEAEAIALALASPKHLLILDDGLGRRIAHLRALTYTGTLGVLVRAKQKGLLAAVRPVIEALQARTSMRLSPNLIEWVLRAAGEG